jgi:hypothetical protein
VEEELVRRHDRVAVLVAIYDTVRVCGVGAVVKC